VNFQRSVITAELRRPEVARRYFCVFGKTTPYGKIFKILLRKFSSRHRSTCCVQISWNLADRKSVKWCFAYLTKMSPGSPAVATALIAPKICPSQPRTIPNRFTFGGVVAESVNTAKTHHKVNPIFGWGPASSRINIRQRCHSPRLVFPKKQTSPRRTVSRRELGLTRRTDIHVGLLVWGTHKR